MNVSVDVKIAVIHTNKMQIDKEMISVCSIIEGIL